MIFRHIAIFFAAVLPVIILPSTAMAQSSEKIPQSIIDKINSKAEQYNRRIDNQTEKYLRRLERQELKIQKKLAKADSLKADLLFSGTANKYRDLRNKMKQRPDEAIKGIYIPNLDSIGIALSFMEQNNMLKISSGNMQKASESFKLIQGKLGTADEIRTYIRNRKQLLKEMLDEHGMGSYLKKFSKQGYYYTKQVQEYKEIWHDPAKVEQKLLTLLNKIPAFKKFAAQNGQLAGLFNLPNTPVSQSTAGLQTIAGMNSAVRNQISFAGPNAGQMLQQNLQQAQSSLNSLKSRLNSVGGSDNDFEIPDFAANTQRTKSFWQRVSYTADIQANRNSQFLPNIADVGLGAVYKIDDKKQIGSQVVYKAGLGNGINHIRLSHEGIGYRFYTDLKFKGSIWISAGYEKHYYSNFRNFSELQSMNRWQESALAGISKKYRLKNKGGEMKLLYDFLWNKKPGGQRVIFRTGIHF